MGHEKEGEANEFEFSKYPRGGEQFENSSRIQFVISLRTVPEWGMKRKGRPTSSSSVRVHVRSSPFFGGRGGSSSFRVRVRVAGNCTVTQQVRQACMTQGGNNS